MSRLVAASLLILSPSAFAATPVERAATIASEIGAPISPAVQPPAAPVSSPARPAAPAVSSVPVKVRVRLSGTGDLYCFQGKMSADVFLSGAARVFVNGGHDDVPVSTVVRVSGACRDGAGSVSGSGRVSLEDAVYLYKDGKGEAVGFVSLEGPLSVLQEAAGPKIEITRDVELTGTLETPCRAHWQCSIVPDPDSR